jgi:hypothetical protein
MPRRLMGFTPGASDLVATSDGDTPTALAAILDPLADNGGGTPTHALAAGSPALDVALTGPATDQRGVARPQGAGYDSGAYEYVPVTAHINGTDCNLIDAITAANIDTAIGACAAGSSGADTITLLTDVTLGAVNNVGANGNNGLPVIASTITIEGAGYTISRAVGAPAFRILDVGSTGVLTLATITITGGDANEGGGLYNEGAVTVNDSTFSDNTGQDGAAIHNNGALMLNGSTISGNAASSYGGGLYNDGTLNVINSTFSGNSAADDGGGILIYNGAGTVINTTIVNNTAGYGGGIASYEALTLTRSLVAGNSASSGREVYNYAALVSTDNLFGHSGETNAQAFDGFTPGASDIVATSDGATPTALAAILDTTLADNGGGTWTHALAAGSPAMDVAPDGPATDQRGVARPQGAGYDSGAFEYVPPTCTATVSGNWSDVFAGCPAGNKIIIPDGIVVTLDEDITLTSDLEVQGTLDPNGMTVTLSGPDGQRLIGHPLTFSDLVVDMNDPKDRVIVNGKLIVAGKLTVIEGRLRSASEYGEVEIQANGTLEQMDNAIVYGDWTNNGAFIANTYQIAFAGSALQTLGGANVTAFNSLVISPTARVFLATTPTVTETLSNYGVLSQTQTVNATTADFFGIGAYPAVVVTTTENLGAVSVIIGGNQAACTNDAGSPAYRQRCFRITAENGGAVDLALYTTAGEDIVADDAIYRYQPTGWAAWGSACGANAGDVCTATGALSSGANDFLIGGSAAPTAVAVGHLAARGGLWSVGLIGMLAAGVVLVWRRKES